MPNIITFTPRPRPVVSEPVPPAADLGLRAHLEEAAQTALDAADKIIAALDQIEDGPSAKPTEPDPSFMAMAAHAGQTVTLHEPIILSEPPSLAEPEVAPEPQEADAAPPVIVPEPALWGGAGNVVSFIGIALLSIAGKT